MKHGLIPGILMLAIFVVTGSLTSGRQGMPSSDRAANSEMQKLADALAGDWRTTESMVRSEYFPNGGSRQGLAHVRLVAGGATLLEEVHSNGSAGPLDGILAIWWDKNAQVYRFFTCFNDPTNPCEVRGTAHWEGKTFVNDYEENVNGKMTKGRDTFFDITPNSHSLVAAIDTGDGKMKTLITTHSIRR
ncbi:MAG TPA: hypothetical protein VJN21_03435 [Candidatus Acidoferrales bacterium]|nr:hypothetical protein [Candidatus Acidoferrales bacterium]